MNVWLIVLLSVAVVVIVAGLALNPLIRKAGSTGTASA
jgi:hypothetical protein